MHALTQERTCFLDFLGEAARELRERALGRLVRAGGLGEAGAPAREAQAEDVVGRPARCRLLPHQAQRLAAAQQAARHVGSCIMHSASLLYYRRFVSISHFCMLSC
jgi:hypothetical protein